MFFQNNNRMVMFHRGFKNFKVIPPEIHSIVEESPETQHVRMEVQARDLCYNVPREHKALGFYQAGENFWGVVLAPNHRRPGKTHQEEDGEQKYEICSYWGFGGGVTSGDNEFPPRA